jgi:DNA-directed RNA polymerase alpha subunit
MNSSPYRAGDCQSRQLIYTIREKRHLVIVKEIGIIPIDALYSPVKLVRYSMEDTCMGQTADFDKPDLEI